MREVKNRRSVPRYKARVPCSVLCASIDSSEASQDERQLAVLTHTEELSLESISLTIPSNPTYGADPSNVGTKVTLELALPIGYVRLSGLLLRHEQAGSNDNLFVFKIEGANDPDWRSYNEHLDSLDREQVF
jgi:hypothetical protein